MARDAGRHAVFEVDAGNRARNPGQQWTTDFDGREADDSLTIDFLVQRACVKASDTKFGDAFGVAVAVSCDTVAVGADQEDSDAVGVNGDQSDNSAAFAGAACVVASNWSDEGSALAGVAGESLPVHADLPRGMPRAGEPRRRALTGHVGDSAVSSAGCRNSLSGR